MIPKSLVEVAGEPFLAHQLRLAYQQGFRRVVLLTGHLGDQIEQFAGDGSLFGLEIVYSRDGHSLRGTGGAVRAALRHLGEEFFVLYGDSFLDVDIKPAYSAFRASGSPALMMVLRNCNRWDQSNVVFDGKMVLLHDKASRGQPGAEWIDFGFSIFSAVVFADWPVAEPFDLSSLTAHLARERALAGFEATQRFYEIGTPAGLAETEEYIVQTAKDRTTSK
jgi:NDP-sugar pyrophosphorylase family protein